ncbi:hypothetical protein [Oscillatoria acuminata]|uniref:Uncharacterized protein n=1 Tax=Oscillatoria acuminata PCC 6304 TaxID=56110 RepID=K9TPF1_9CYAN|nr:hypothetical protein [Oscillatoria acuminata]AFY83879.1 hypothetical protein Oscil6304_4358 [Oscillatoria acuminata PCC 6304]
MSSRLLKPFTVSDRRQINRLRAFMPNRDSQLARLRELSGSQDAHLDYLRRLREQGSRPRLPEGAGGHPRRVRAGRKRTASGSLVGFLQRQPWVLGLLAWVLLMGMAWSSWNVLVSPGFTEVPEAPVSTPDEG